MRANSFYDATYNTTCTRSVLEKDMQVLLTDTNLTKDKIGQELTSHPSNYLKGTSIKKRNKTVVLTLRHAL